MSDSDDFFGAGNKSASFKGQPGITWQGTIDRVGNKVQKREYTPDGSLGALKFYPGTQDPIWQLPVTILTDVRDPAIPNDDGRRVIYFEGAKRAALKEALRSAGHRGGPVLGDWLALQYYAQEQGKGNEPKKLYRAQYVINPNPAARGEGYVAPDAAPVQNSAAEFFAGGGQQQAQQAAMNQPFQAANPATAPGWAQPAAAQPAFAGQVQQPAAAGSPFAPVADNGQAPWPPAPAQQSAFVQAAAPEIAAMQPVGAQPDQPLAPQRPWGNVPA